MGQFFGMIFYGPRFGIQMIGFHIVSAQVEILMFTETYLVY